MTDLMTLSRRSFMIMPVALAACKRGYQVIELSGLSMGTSYNIVAVDHSNLLDRAEVQSAVSTALIDVNTSMSNWDDSSEISRFNALNAGESMVPSAALGDILSTAAQVSRASLGHFDTTVGPLIELWGFGAPGTVDMPSDLQIAAARAKTGLTNTVSVENGALRKVQDHAQIYLAGIGKGYGADHIARSLASLGLTDFLVEIGGDLYASGRNPDGLPWQIGIEAPNATDRSVLGVVGLSELGLATSGDYRNFFEVDGQRYSHLIDPTTGRPVTHGTASATVIAENAMLADAWSTAMHVLGRQRGLEIAAREGIAVQFIERDPNVAKLSFKTYNSAAFDRLTA